MAATAATEQQDDLFDARFEFDAPRYYDFQAMSPGSPADKWFDTAPDGPGCKPEKPTSNREPFKQLQDNASNQTQGQQAAAAAAGAGAAGNADKPRAQEQQPKKVNIVTSWGQAAAAAAAGAGAGAASGTGGGNKAAARPARKSVPVGRKPSVPAMAAGRKSVPVGRKGPAAAAAAAAAAEQRAAASSRPASARPLRGKEPRRVSRSTGVNSSGDASSTPGARTEPPVTRSLSRLGFGLFSPVPENKPKLGSPPTTRARTAGQRFYTVQKDKSTLTRTKQPASAQKLHQVLAPKLKQTVRSTKALTLPDDFELETSKRGDGRPASAQQPEKSPFKPLAERVREFQFKTPPRFKSRPSKPASNHKKKSPITKAEAPRLLTSTRNRPRSCKSQQEVDEEELQQQFKARPVDTRVLSSSGQLGVPRVEKPHVTEFKPFNLRSDSRARVRRSHEQPSMQQAAAAAHFRAQPLNRSILDGPTFKPTHKEKQGLTKPVSPELLTKRRAATDRHEEYEQQHRARLQQEEEAARQASEFKARPVVAGGPFVVHESDAPLTVPAEPQLVTDVRAVERAEFDAHMTAKMQQQEEERRRQAELKRQREEEATKEYRKKLRFSARPMPNFDQPFHAMPSDRPLTNAKTPNFASKRLRRTGG